MQKSTCMKWAVMANADVFYFFLWIFRLHAVCRCRNTCLVGQKAFFLADFFLFAVSPFHASILEPNFHLNCAPKNNSCNWNIAKCKGTIRLPVHPWVLMLLPIVGDPVWWCISEFESVFPVLFAGGWKRQLSTKIAYADLNYFVFVYYYDGLVPADPAAHYSESDQRLSSVRTTKQENYCTY